MWWHQWPLLTLAAVPTTFLVQTAVGVPPNAQVTGPVVWALASFGAAAFTSLRTALAGLLVVAAPVAILHLIGTIPTFSDLLWAFGLLTLVPWITAGSTGPGGPRR